MPLPIAHSAAGLVAYLALRDGTFAAQSPERQRGLAVLAIAAANLPDLDFIPGLLIGTPGAFHHGASHSIFAALAGALLLFLATRPLLRGFSSPKVATVLILATVSHPVLDYSSLDTSSPFGVPLLWPLRSEYSTLPIPVFSDVVRSEGSNWEFLTTLFNPHNVIAAIAEILFAVSIIAGTLATRSDGGTLRFLRFAILSGSGFLLFVLVRLGQI